MKKFLLVIGIVIVVIGILALLYAALNRFTFFNTLDGSNDFYSRIRVQMRISFIIGAVTEVIGIACLIVRTKL